MIQLLGCFISVTNFIHTHILCSDHVKMASYAPLFVNANDRKYIHNLFFSSFLINFQWKIYKLSEMWIFFFFIFRWNPDAIVFNSHEVYGTPSYWVQFMFRESNGAKLLKSQLQTPYPNSLAASAILWKNSQDQKTYFKIKVLYMLLAF